MSLSSPKINKAFENKAWAEKNAFGKDEKTFAESVEASMGRIDDIVENSYMVNKAKELLADNLFKNKSASKIREMAAEERIQKKIEELCDPYDPAVILAICIKLREVEEKRKKMH